MLFFPDVIISYDSSWLREHKTAAKKKKTAKARIQLAQFSPFSSAPSNRA